MNQGIDFLTELYDDEDTTRGYSTLNVARSALSSVLLLPNDVPFGQHRDVTLFMKGVKALRPSVPRYMTTWDPALVLTFLGSMTPLDSLSLLQLAKKTAMLMCLTTGLRGHTLMCLDIKNLQKTDSMIMFCTKPTDFKQGGRAPVPTSIEFCKYDPEENICVFTSLCAYLERTAGLRGEATQLFITSSKPFKPIARATLSRWLLSVMTDAGIDTGTFTAGSTRAAASSAALRKGATLDTVLDAGGWKRSSTFTKFYNRPLAATKQNKFAETVLR